MSPITIEDEILDYLEHANSCAEGSVNPPASSCSTQVQMAYGFLKYHPLSGLLVFFFLAIIARMIYSILFPSEAHH